MAKIDRKAIELDELEKNKEGILKGKKESEELMRKFEAKERLTDKEQKVADYLRSKYDQLIKEMNETRAMLNKKPIPYRQDYMTHIKEFSVIGEYLSKTKEKLTQAQIDALLAGDYTQPNMGFNRFALPRLGKKTKLDAIGNYLQYLDTALNEISYSPAIAHARKFIRYAVKQPNVGIALGRWLNDIIGKRSINDQNIIGDVASFPLVQLLRHRIAANALIGNINFWAINLSNFSIAYDELGNWLNVGLKNFLTNKELKDFAFSNSVILKERSIDPDIDLSTLDKLETAISSITSLIEYNNVGSVYVGAYLKGIHENMPPDKAMKYADSIAQRTQAGYRPYQVNAWMRSNSGKLMSQFQTWSFNMMNHVLYDLKVAAIPKNILFTFTKGEKEKVRWKALFSLIITSIIVNQLYKKAKLRKPYTIEGMTPTIAGISANRYSDIGPVRIGRDLKNILAGKTPETRRTALIRTLTMALPYGGTQMGRFLTGKIFPSSRKEEEKKQKLYLLN